MTLPTFIHAEVRQLERDQYGKWRVVMTIGEAEIGQFSVSVSTGEQDANNAIAIAKSKLRRLGAAMADHFERYPT